MFHPPEKYRKKNYYLLPFNIIAITGETATREEVLYQVRGRTRLPNDSETKQLIREFWDNHDMVLKDSSELLKPMSMRLVHNKFQCNN